MLLITLRNRRFFPRLFARSRSSARREARLRAPVCRESVMMGARARFVAQKPRKAFLGEARPPAPDAGPSAA
jgi:hypothetical protein